MLIFSSPAGFSSTAPFELFVNLTTRLELGEDVLECGVGGVEVGVCESGVELGDMFC